MEFLLKGVLIPKVLNDPFASFSFMNLDFLLSYAAYFDDRLNLKFLVFTSFASLFFYFFCTINNKSTCLFYNI